MRERTCEKRLHGCVAPDTSSPADVGSYVQANRVDALVDAARTLRDRGVSDFEFIFVGDGPGKEQCEQLARRYGLNNVLFWHSLPKRSVRGCP